MSREIAILDFIQKHTKSEGMDHAMKLVTRLGNYGILYLTETAALIAHPKTRKKGFAMWASLGIEAFFCNVLIKPLGARMRPYMKNVDVDLLIEKPWDHSFPSGHAGASFTVFSSLLFNHDPLAAPAFVQAVLTSFSRLYLYVHYPSDVVAGAGLGMLSGYLGDKLVNKYYDRARAFFHRLFTSGTLPRPRHRGTYAVRYAGLAASAGTTSKKDSGD